MKKVVGSLLALSLLVSPAMASAANSHSDILLVAKKGDNGKSHSSGNDHSNKVYNGGSTKEDYSKTTTTPDSPSVTEDTDNNVDVTSKNSKESKKVTKEALKQEKQRLIEEYKNNKTDLKARAKEMRQNLESTVESKEEKATLLEATAELLEEAGDLDEAINTQEEAVQQDLNNVEPYKKLAKLMEKKGNKQIKAFVNGKHPKFDVPPVIKAGRTLVPIRAISETLGADVTWNQQEQTATIVKDGVEIKLVLNEVKAYVNGKEIQLDVPSTSINSRIVVPLRFISEAFDAAVKWEDETDSVIIVDENADTGETQDGTATEENTAGESQDGTAIEESPTDGTNLEGGTTQETPTGEAVEGNPTTEETQADTVTTDTTSEGTVPTENTL